VSQGLRQRSLTVRAATAADLDAIAELCTKLWPDAPAAEHREHAAAIVAGTPPSTLPLALFVAADGARIVGFVEVGLRSHANGCDPTRPVGFLEGWFVEADVRRAGIGRLLVERAEAWAAAHGCTELASDTWLDAEVSQRAHAALGFEVVDRCVDFRKPITTPPLAKGDDPP
jgi:aminoglycoside 6'-N-acetyltransferase I